MLTHYIKTALRNLAKQKVLAFINLAGLSMGLACFLLFLLYSVNEYSYDRFHKNTAEIYRVNDWYTQDDASETGDPSSYVPEGPAMKKDLPGVVDFVRIRRGDAPVRVKDQITHLSVGFADPQFFSVFTFPLLSGKGTEALREPTNIVLTKDKALQLFGRTDVVGRRMEIQVEDTFRVFTIGGVAENVPLNSSIRFDVMGSFAYLATQPMVHDAADNWHRTIGIETFVQLRPGSTLMHDTKTLRQFRLKYYPDEAADVAQGKPERASFRLQPLRSMHMDTGLQDAETTDPKKLALLLSIAGGILLIACINFTTLAIGRSAGRAREIGVRKVIGGRKKQLVWQFLTESLVLSIFSAVIGLFLASLLLPYFNRLSEKSLDLSMALSPAVGWMLAGLILLVGLLSGSYPALLLSRFRPVEVLKSKIRLGGSNIFTKSLITLQFVLSIGLIVSTLIILQQVSFMRSKDLGFNKENIVVINVEGTAVKKAYPLFRQALLSSPQIVRVTSAEMGLGEGEGQMGEQFEVDTTMIGVIEYPVDADFITTLGMQLKAGRNFDPAIPSDTVSAVIVNESLVKTMPGLTAADAIGMPLKQKTRQGIRSKTIIGVAKDFNFEALTRTIRPQLFFQRTVAAPRRFFVRIRPGDPSRALSSVAAAWKAIAPGLPFDYHFLEEKIDNQYRAEERWSQITGWAGGISIFLACIGLLGLAALAVSNRTREIGIRKVLGAGLVSLVQLLSKDFIRLVVLALVIAAPMVWYLMNKWLEDFAYRIHIGAGVFIGTGIAALLIALVVTGSQAVKAGLANPVKALRNE